MKGPLLKMLQCNKSNDCIYKLCFPTNQENWLNILPYMALYWANVLAIVPILGRCLWFVECIPSMKMMATSPYNAIFIMRYLTWKLLHIQ